MSSVVYALEDPRDSRIHYVGITDDPYRRFCEHIRGSSGNLEKNGWIFECRQANIVIIMRTLEIVDDLAIALEREKFWIEHFLEAGMPLDNCMVARSILKERVRMAKKVARIQRMSLPKDKKISTTVDAEELRKAREAWNAGATSVRTLMNALGTTYYQAQKLYRHVRGENTVKDECIDAKAMAAWQKGCQSNRKLAEALGVSYYQAQTLTKKIKASINQQETLFSLPKQCFCRSITPSLNHQEEGL